MDSWLRLIGIFFFGYVASGVLFNFILFLWASVQKLDQKYEEWGEVLHTVKGMTYFHFIGSFLWLPTLVALRKENIKRRLLFLYKFSISSYQSKRRKGKHNDSIN